MGPVRRAAEVELHPGAPQGARGRLREVPKAGHLSGQGGDTGEGGGQFICTTFRPEMVHVADKCYAVSYGEMNSKINVFSTDRALEFVEESQRVK